MNASEIKLCLAIAQSGQDLSRFDFGVLDGCGCDGFEPVTVSAGVVARLMRYQYRFLNGSWDWAAFNQERWIYQKRIQLAELSRDDVWQLVGEKLQAALSGERLTA